MTEPLSFMRDAGLLRQGPSKRKFTRADLDKAAPGATAENRTGQRSVAAGSHLLYIEPTHSGAPNEPQARRREWPRGGVVTQRSAKPFTPVQFRPWPPLAPAPAPHSLTSRRPFSLQRPPLGTFVRGRAGFGHISHIVMQCRICCHAGNICFHIGIPRLY